MYCTYIHTYIQCGTAQRGGTRLCCKRPSQLFAGPEVDKLDNPKPQSCFHVHHKPSKHIAASGYQANRGSADRLRNLWQRLASHWAMLVTHTIAADATDLREERRWCPVALLPPTYLLYGLPTLWSARSESAVDVLSVLCYVAL